MKLNELIEQLTALKMEGDTEVVVVVRNKQGKYEDTLDIDKDGVDWDWISNKEHTDMKKAITIDVTR